MKTLVFNAATGEKSEKEIPPLTPEEIAERERLQAETPAPEKTQEERIAELEEALEMLLSGVTEDG